jgi:hypothetical protein
VCDGIYQVRGYDMANATFIRTDNGWIVFDVMMCKENMEAAKALMEKHFGKLDIKAVLYSHSHVDHYGGVLGLIRREDAADGRLSLEEQLASGKVLVLAPQGFLKYAVSENIYAGRAMARRAQYQYGVLLKAGERGKMAIGIGLGLLDFDKNAKVVYSKLDTALTSGDGDDYAKILIAAPDRPLVDIEITSIDAYTKYNLLIMGTKGTFKATPSAYEMVYIKDGENPERSVVETFLQNEAGEPIYCSEKLVKHEESGTFDGTAFDVGTAKLYEQLYYKITEGKPMDVTPEMAAQIISVIETVHAENPLPLKY